MRKIFEKMFAAVILVSVACSLGAAEKSKPSLWFED